MPLSSLVVKIFLDQVNQNLVGSLSLFIGLSIVRHQIDLLDLELFDKSLHLVSCERGFLICYEGIRDAKTGYDVFFDEFNNCCWVTLVMRTASVHLVK
jgi:hypothetical protein